MVAHSSLPISGDVAPRDFNVTPPERVAQRTWDWLAQGYALGARLGEETLTDLLMLDMLPHQRSRAFHLYPTTKAEEAQCGADLLLAVRYATGRWARFAIQAKKLYREDIYRTLNPGAKCLGQLTRLERFARLFHALPVYILYNHSSSSHSSPTYWHCPLRFQPDQLGCTLLPSRRVRQAIHWRKRTFDRLNRIPEAKPWRCIFHCPASEQLIRHMGSGPLGPIDDDRSADSAQPRPYDWPFEPIEGGWPEWAFDLATGELTPAAIDDLRREIAQSFRSEPSREIEDDSATAAPPADAMYLPRVFFADQTATAEPRG